MFEVGGTVDLTGHEQRAVEQKRRLTPLDDLKSDALERATAGRSDQNRIPSRQRKTSQAPRLGMDHHRQVGGAQFARQPLHPTDMIEVAVAEDDHIHIVGRELQAPHVLDQAVRRDPGIEQHAMLPPSPSHRHERRKPVLGSRRMPRRR